MNKIWIAIALLLILVGGYYLLSPGPSAPPVETNEVAIRNSGFEPQVIAISAGTTVTWTNEDPATNQVASDPHPIHTDLPGLSSGEMNPGAAYSYTFTTPGTFGYHNHLSPFRKGRVMVR